MKNVIAERVIHKGINRVALRFPYDAELITIVKGFPDARWSQQMGCWHIEDSSDVIDLLLKAFYDKAYVDYSALKPNLAEKIRLKREEEQRKNDKKLNGLGDADLPPLSDKGKADIDRYRRWMESHRYPETTIRTYTGMVTTFLRFISPKEASECTSDDLVRLVDEYILPEGLSYSYQNQMVSAVKKFYGKIYRSVIEPGEFTRPRPQHRLPNVLSKEEVKRILDAPVNEKHRVMLSLIYACGLRRSELIELVPSDLERDRKLLRIRQSKGFRDRVVPISEKVIQMIDLYISHFRPKKYLFEGQYAGNRYSASSLDKVFKEAHRRAGLKREVTLHGLRHSYATHLLESGTDLRYIQELLGHKSSRTTEIYTHVTTKSIQKIRSPFDDL
ncbi:MAG: site-specific integrase [Bacteroidales bacterium]|nr:site-specific integrase [Bacteroidales bacterium]